MMDSIQNWLEADGDNTLALDWPLDENSHVWEIGGYEGRWAAQMAEKFDCYIDIFEPQGWAVQKMQERFKGNPKISIHPYGLWIENKWMYMGNYFTDGASVMKPADSDHLLEFKIIYHEIYQFNHEIDLCLMNVEGAEFTLISDLIGSGIIPRLQRFWCQFHEFVEGSEDWKVYIYKRMEETHNLIWDFYPTAVAWERKTLTLPSPSGRGTKT